MDGFKIEKVDGLEILDSRGNPTVRCVVTLKGGARGVACVPSGASTGVHEAHELRDGDKARYLGKGVQKAVAHVNGELAAAVAGLDAREYEAVDAAMIKADGGANKEHLGANAILGVSLAAAKAAAAADNIALWQFLWPKEIKKLPIPMMNILNGGAHAANNVDIQEFMIIPSGAPSFREGLRWAAEIYHTLGGLLKRRGLASGVGDEGGFAPSLQNDEEAIRLILEAVEEAGYHPGRDINLALDAAVSEWWQDGGYRTPKGGKDYTPQELCAYWKDLAGKYPIISIEDGMAEDDWTGWQQLTRELGGKIQLVGDDLFVTNIQRLGRGLKEKAANAILIKPNQIGSLSETLQAVKTVQDAGWGVILSHRSGETEDASIADIAVATGCGQIKSGAPCRSDRVAKYNRLLVIEDCLSRNH